MKTRLVCVPAGLGSTGVALGTRNSCNGGLPKGGETLGVITSTLSTLVLEFGGPGTVYMVLCAQSSGAVG